MDAYTKDAKLTGVPLKDTKIIFQKYVDNIKIDGNISGLAGKSIKRGNIEFWPNNYSSVNSAKIPGAKDSANDCGDQWVKNLGYGSMQIHDYKSNTTIFALNNFHSTTPDFGFGSNKTGKHSDWTFSRAGINYKTINVYTFLGNR